MLVRVSCEKKEFGYHSLRRWLPQKLATLVRERKSFIVDMVNDGFINNSEMFVGFKADEEPYYRSYTVTDGVRHISGQFYPVVGGYELEFPAGAAEVYFDSLESCIESILLGCRRRK